MGYVRGNHSFKGEKTLAPLFLALFSRPWTPWSLCIFFGGGGGLGCLNLQACGYVPLGLEGASWPLAGALVWALRESTACPLSLLSSWERRPQSPGLLHLHSGAASVPSRAERVCAPGRGATPAQLPHMQRADNDFAHLPTLWGGCGDRGSHGRVPSVCFLWPPFSTVT